MSAPRMQTRITRRSAGIAVETRLRPSSVRATAADQLDLAAAHLAHVVAGILAASTTALEIDGTVDHVMATLTPVVKRRVVPCLLSVQPLEAP